MQSKIHLTQNYLNKNTQVFISNIVSNTFLLLFILRILYYIGKRKGNHISRHLVDRHN